MVGGGGGGGLGRREQREGKLLPIMCLTGQRAREPDPSTTTIRRGNRPLPLPLMFLKCGIQQELLKAPNYYRAESFILANLSPLETLLGWMDNLSPSFSITRPLRVMCVWEK